jgi:hypothetical protein
MIAVMTRREMKTTVSGIELPQTPKTDLEIIEVESPLLLPARAATEIRVPEAK